MDKPQNLEPRGELLWDSVTAEKDFDAAGYALLEDACRTADIITRLHDMLHQDEQDWLRAVEKDLGDTEQILVVVNVHPLLGEIRSQRLALNRLMNQLGIAHSSREGDGESSQAKQFWKAAEEQFGR